uniref:SEH1L n=1 Tax=Plectus sambesii TaxID=2011161 RepID=A0A914WFS4_9BILA
MSFSSKQIFHEHKDLVHHVAYDFHGKRIATCSSDQSVTVWDLNQNGVWVRSSSWKTHGGPVWKVIWAHPEFGQILATCSFDRSAHIWEEVVSDNDPERQGGRSQQKSGPTTHWKKRTALVDSRSNVTDIKFAPRHLGLMLATASAQGVVRIYEAPDIMDLARWNLCQDFSVSRYRCSCVSWSSSRFHAPLIGSIHPTTCVITVDRSWTLIISLGRVHTLSSLLGDAFSRRPWLISLTPF